MSADLNIEDERVKFEAAIRSTDPSGALSAPDFSTHTVRGGLQCYNDASAEAAFCGWIVAQKARAPVVDAPALTDEAITDIWSEAVEGRPLRQIEPHHVWKFARAIIARITGEGKA